MDLIRAHLVDATSTSRSRDTETMRTLLGATFAPSAVYNSSLEINR